MIQQGSIEKMQERTWVRSAVLHLLRSFEAQ